MTRIVLVTGGNRGIGFEVCRQLSRKGMRVVLTSRNCVDGEKAAEILLREGLQVTPRPLDVTDPQEIEAIGSFIEKEFGQLDVLVNNAGVYPDEGVSLFDVPIETVRETMGVNFYAPLAICRAFIPLMRRNGYGRVVNVSSGAGQLEEMDGGNRSVQNLKGRPQRADADCRERSERTEHQGQFDLSRLGPHPDGRPRRPAHRRAGRLRHCLGRHPARRRPHRRIFPRSKSDPVVKESVYRPPAIIPSVKPLALTQRESSRV